MPICDTFYLWELRFSLYGDGINKRSDVASFFDKDNYMVIIR